MAGSLLVAIINNVELSSFAVSKDNQNQEGGQTCIATRRWS